MNAHQQLRPRKSRCKTGCLCCRLRKKKCDEQKPTCSSCSRLGLKCSYLASTEFAWRQRMGLSSGEVDDPLETLQQPGKMPPSRRVSAPSPAGEFRPPCMGEGRSPLLLQAYMEQIVPYMLCAPKEFANPFIQDVLPMAFSDPLIMNAVMALGGSTLGVHQPIDQEVKISFFKSYGDAIKELKHRLAHWAADQSSESEGIRIFLAVLLMCHYEAIRGNQKGEFFVHLRAGRVLAPVVHATRDGPLAPLVGVLLENYVYFELWSCLRLTPDDSDISAAAQVAIPQLDALRHMHTFGVMFGDAAEIFQYAPEICKLATRRKIEVETGSDLGCAATFQRLKSEITSCKGCTDNNHYHRHHHNDHTHPDTDQTFAQGRIAAGIVSQSAVFLFLLSAYLQDLDMDYLCEVSQPLVERMIDVLPQLRRTSFANTCFWPVIVTASYATTELQRQRITEYFLPFMPIIVRALELLQWVWETEGAFGLAGLAMVVEDHGTSYCFG